MIGNPKEPARQSQCIAAAELLTLAETAREAALADDGDARKLELAIRADGAARRALETLGIQKPTDNNDQTDGGGYGIFIEDDDDEEAAS